MTALPPYFFRVRDNGALVFRVDSNNRNRRIEMTQIAVANTNRGDFKPHGATVLSEADEAAITSWLQKRTALLAARSFDDVRQTVDHLNRTAQWAQSAATEADLEALTDDLLMAMHDLRSVLVRKKSERMAADHPPT